MLHGVSVLGLIALVGMAEALRGGEDPLMMAAEAASSDGMSALSSIESIEAEADSHARAALMEASSTGADSSPVDVASALKACQQGIDSKTSATNAAEESATTCSSKKDSQSKLAQIEQVKSVAASDEKTAAVNALKVAYEAEKASNEALQSKRTEAYNDARNCRINRSNAKEGGRAEASKYQERAKNYAAKHATGLLDAVRKAKSEGEEEAKKERAKVTEAQEAANTAVKAAQEDAQTTEAAALSEETAVINSRIDSLKESSQGAIDEANLSAKTARDKAAAEREAGLNKLIDERNSAQESKMKLEFRIKDADANRARDEAAYQGLQKESLAYRDEVKKSLIQAHTDLVDAQASPTGF